MAISSQTLFHFTRTAETVRKILEGNFKPSYCLEKIPFSELAIGVPMVCFCDIPLTQTKDHISEYGDYAIGLKKSWGIRKKLNPVFYVSSGSQISERLNTLTRYLLEHHHRALNQEKSIADGVSMAFELKTFFDIISYTKPIRGSNWNKRTKKFKKKERNLYDEREWRYIPYKANEVSLGNLVPLNIVLKDIFLNDNRLRELNFKVKSELLTFTPNDIEYIIVKKKSEIVTMYDLIHDVKKRSGFDEKAIKELLTKIIHVERIHEDF